MYQDLIKICQDNIQYLKACLGISEAHIWGGTKAIKTKYTKHSLRLKKKIREEETYLKLYKGQLLMSLLRGMVDSNVVKQETNTNFRQELYSFSK